MIPYSRQWIDEDDIKAVVNVLRSDWVTHGPKIAEFEKKVANYCGAKYAVVVNSGTSALHIACLAAGIGPGDEVITSPITFVASANCALYVGAKPVFSDISPDTYCINPEEIKKNITKRTKAIIPVDFAGHPCEMNEINEIAREHKLIVIEDAAHSLGAEYHGKKVGSLANMTIFSFHPVKHITTGEGGIVVTNSQDYYEKLLLLRSHGITKDPNKFVNKDASPLTHNQSPITQGVPPITHNQLPIPPPPYYYEMQHLGFNYRITDIQCALGISQMEKLDRFVKRRREIADDYNKAFKNIDEIITPTELFDCKSSYHLYTIQLKTIDRLEVFNKLSDKGLGVQVHYIPVHLQPYYRDNFGYKEGDFPLAEDYYRRCISLPVYPKMTTLDITYVINLFKTFSNTIN